MKILYVSKGDHVDYQDDCLFIGLKELFGDDVVDVNKRSHIYTSYDEEAAKKLYGMGMTATRVLPDTEIDRTDIGSKIKHRYFDLVVYGSIWRSSGDIDKVLEYYPKNKVVAVDGEDEQHIHQVHRLGIPYFKRELIRNDPTLFPIAFAAPTNKGLGVFDDTKIKDFSFITPLDKRTYIYNTERDYYNDYAESRFGVTLKKAGWDCLRHYEIMSNGCIPYFIDIESCPKLTMFNFPKDLCKSVIADLKSFKPVDVYSKYADKFQLHFNNNNTTKALATYFVNTLSQIKN
jgi:hypothetical protein